MDTVPRMFVLMGNFQSYSATSATTDYDAVRQNFSALAGVLQRHKRLVVRAPAGASAARNSGCGGYNAAAAWPSVRPRLLTCSSQHMARASVVHNLQLRCLPSSVLSQLQQH